MAAEDGANRFDDFPGGLLLHDKAIGAGAQRPFGVEQLLVHRKHEHRQPRKLVTQRADQFCGVLVLERPIHDGDIGLQALHHLRHMAFAIGLATDDEVGFLVDDIGQAHTDERVIIHEENFFARQRCRCRRWVHG